MGSMFFGRHVSLHLVLLGQFLLADLHCAISEKANGLSWPDHTPLHSKVRGFTNISAV